jgi:hypothetical protein
VSSRLFLIITTHTTLHLERVLFGVRHSSRLPDELVISCDNNLPALLTLSRDCCGRLGLAASLVQREHMGVCRLAQVINNGLRYFADLPPERAITSQDRVVVIQGDCCPGKHFLAEHMRLGANADLVVGFRHDITEEQSNRFSDEALLRGEDPVGLTLEQKRSILARHSRFVWHARLRPLRLVKSHKPPVLGADFSVRYGALQSINGMDEEYVGYGSEDDDLGRRLYRSGATSVVGVRELELYHIWHQTRKGAKWEDSSGVRRFRISTPTRAVHGIENPLPQAPCIVHPLL